MASKMLDKIKAGLSQEESAKKPGLEKLEEKIKRANEVFRDEDNIPSKERVTIQPKVQVKKDTFTMPKEEYLLIQQTIDRSMKLMKSLNKSEVIRLGLAALGQLNDESLLELIGSIERLKVGRPKRG